MIVAQLNPAEAATRMGEVLLPLLVLVPLIGALVVAFAKHVTLSRTIALGFAFAVLALSFVLLGKSDLVHAPAADAPIVSQAYGQMQHVWTAPRFLQLGGTADRGTSFGMSLAADAISVWLVLLTTILVPCAMIATPSRIERSASYYAWMLVLQSAIIGAFLASDVLLFYVFFELTLVPSYFLIGQWGGAERRRAATKFFVYTFAGSVFMLVSIIYVGAAAKTFDMAACVRYAQTGLTQREQFWVLLGFLVGLGVKVPLFPLHTWLPLTYTQAPAAVTALLTGLLAKLGTYGLLRIALPIGLFSFDHQSQPAVLGWVVTLALIAIVYAALIAWVQKDFKTLVAYSSISHLGFCVLALACISTMGGQASVLYMINHGISTAALFLMLGMIEQRVGTRSVDEVSGLGRDRPLLAFFFVLFVMSSIGLPLTNGFVSEFLAIQSTLAARLSLWTTVIAASGVVLGAVYMLHLTAKLIFGPTRYPVEQVVDEVPRDLNGRELAALVPLAVLVLALGVFPNVVLDSIRGPVATLVRPVDAGTTQTTRANDPLLHVVDAPRIASADVTLAATPPSN